MAQEMGIHALVAGQPRVAPHREAEGFPRQGCPFVRDEDVILERPQPRAMMLDVVFEYVPRLAVEGDHSFLAALVEYRRRS
jgi:hypothetical protein